MKLHTQLDHDGYIPTVIRVTPAKVHDMVEGRKFSFHPGDTLLFDRGYFDSGWFQQLNDKRINFVTRIKSNVLFEWTERRNCDRKAGILGDWIGTLGGSCGEKCKAPLRMIRYRDPETGKELEFLTNLLDINAKVVADLYRERWQIELFFKWVKQNLKIKTYLGTDLNAVLVQVWIAMIAYLLVRMTLQKAPPDAISAQRLLVFIAARILLETPINQAWKDFQRTRRKQDDQPGSRTRNTC